MSQVHETTKWISTAFAGVATFAAGHGDQILAVITAALACASAGASWYIAQRAKIRKADRDQRWYDAVMDWQIEQLKLGRLQLPRDRRQPQSDAPPPPPVSILDPPPEQAAPDA